MRGPVDKTIWQRLGLIAILLPVCFFFPLAWLAVAFFASTIFQDLKPLPYPTVPARRTWRDAKPEDDNWLALFCEGCESPAEEQFLLAMVREFDLKPDNGVLKSPRLTLAMQVKVDNYRYDFLANGRQIIEVDGAAYHSSPEQVERDSIRDGHSVQDGYKVLRIPAIVVFKRPEEAIRRVKAVLAETPTFTAPQAMTKPAKKQTIGGYIDAFVGAANEINRYVEIEGQVRKATEGFLSAISHEQLLLEALVAGAELDRREEDMSPDARRHYDELWGKFPTNEDLRLPTYEWKTIAMPPPVANKDAQQRIEAKFASARDERNMRFADLKARCEKDPVFTRFFCQGLAAARFPEPIKIVPWRHFLAASTPNNGSPARSQT